MGRVTKKTTYKEMIKLFMFICGISYFLMGCGAKPLTKEDKVSIQSVRICNYVERKEEIEIVRSGDSMPYIGTSFKKGLKYEASKREAQAEIGAEWQYICDQSGIYISDIVKDQFDEQLKKSGLFHSIVDTEADAEFKLIILSYGFIDAPGSLAKFKPTLNVFVRLVRPDGTIVWKDGEFITAFNSKTPAHSQDEYLNNPELIRDAFTVASKIVCGEIVNNMVGK